jgi:hypothetical protein
VNFGYNLINETFTASELDKLNQTFAELFVGKEEITAHFFIDQFFIKHQILLNQRDAAIFLLWKSPDDWEYAF